MPEGTDRAFGAGNIACRNTSGSTTIPRFRDGTWGQEGRLEVRPQTSPWEWGMPDLSKWDWKGWLAALRW
jgi:hypothetical protein